MRGWYESVRALGLRAVIVHDGLSAAFIRQHATRRIRFVRTGPYPWSPNDQRFFAWRDLLRNLSPDRVFLTDISDVRVASNPFLALERTGARLVIGDEVYPPPAGAVIRRHPWLMQKIRDTRKGGSSAIYSFFRRHQFDLPTLNAGVIGGCAADVRELLERFVRIRRRIGRPDLNLNMPIVNYSVHRFFRGRFHHGAPVTSVFKGYQRRRGDVAFIHK